MNYQITINTKSKSYSLITPDLEGLLKLIRESSIIWLNDKSQGFWVPHSEIIEIIFQEQKDSETVITVEDLDKARKEALIHQQQTIEG